MVLASYELWKVILFLLAVFVLIPLVGAFFLRVSCRIYRVPASGFLRCWAAYLAAYVTASLIGTLILFVAGGAGSPPGWLVGVVLVQAVAVHVTVVPLVLRTPIGKGMLIHLTALAMYSLVLAAVLWTPVQHARKAARRAQIAADLKVIGLTSMKLAESHRSQLLPSFDEVARRGAGAPSGTEFSYLPSVVQEHRRKSGSLLTRGIISSRLIASTATTPLAWASAPESRDVVVCFMDCHVETVSRERLDNMVRETLRTLGEDAP